MIKKLLYIIVLFLSLANVAFAGQTTVPTAPGSGYCLISLSTGLYNPTPSCGSSGSGSTTPAGLSTYIQLNSNNKFDATSTFTFSSSTATLDIGTTTSINSNANAGNFNVVSSTTNATNIALFRANVNSFAQMALVNANAGNTASADFIVGNNLNDTRPSSYFGDFGINSSGNADPSFTGFLSNDTYVYGSDGGLDLGTATTSASSTIKFFTGGLLSGNQRMTILNNGNIGIQNTNPPDAFDIGDISLDTAVFSVNTSIPEFKMGDISNVSSGNVLDINGASGNLNYSYTGASAFFINSANFIGLSTTSPLSEFYVVGTTSTTSLTTYQTAPNISLENIGTLNNSFSSIDFREVNASNTPVSTSMITGINVAHTKGAESGALAFHTNNAGSFAERMRITAAGNVGIGTTTPASSLVVIGQVGATGYNITGVGNVIGGDGSINNRAAYLDSAGLAGNALQCIQSTGGTQLTLYGNCVISVATDATLTGGTITTTGTLGLNLATANTWTGKQTINSLQSTNATTTNLAITGLSNTFLAVNANGNVISTTSPSGSPGGANTNFEYNCSGSFCGTVNGFYTSSNGYFGFGATSTPGTLVSILSSSTLPLGQIVLRIATSTTNLFSVSDAGAIVSGTINSAAIVSSANITGSNLITTGIVRAGLGTASAPAFQNGSQLGSGIFFPTSKITAVTASSTEVARFQTGTSFVPQVGIGTTTPDSALDIAGFVRFEGSSTITTASISGAIVGLGCDTATTSVDTSYGSTTVFATTPQTFPGAGLFWQSYLSATGVVTTEVCSDVTITPTASLYNVRIIR